MILKGTSKNPAFMASSLTDRVIRAGLSADRQALSLFPGLCPTGRNVAQYSRANKRYCLQSQKDSLLKFKGYSQVMG